MPSDQPLTPCAVDLDGSLVKTDTLWEMFAVLIRKQPLRLFMAAIWLVRGRAYFKSRLAEVAELNPATLPYNGPLLQWLKQQHEEGKKLILATAAPHTVATSVAHHLGIFDTVMTSTSTINLKGECKAAALQQELKGGEFHYVGNSRADLKVWQAATGAIIAGQYSQALKNATARSVEVIEEFPTEQVSFRSLMKQCRLHQWAKNSLLFLPAVAGHQLDLQSLTLLIIGFFCFSLCASGTYIINDLLDLESDRHHSTKCRRPLAAGVTPIWLGLLLSSVMVGGSFALAGFLSPVFVACLSSYLLITLLYSLVLKKYALLDVATLSLLYVTRVIAGALLLGAALSNWLITFSLFLFMSLAFAKRFVELSAAGDDDLLRRGRGYASADTPIVQTLGVAAGMMSVLVLALYLNSPASDALYKQPQLLAAGTGIYLFWISWVWFKAGRGELNEDPVLFAITDRTSLMAGGLFLASMALATAGV